MGLSLNPVAFIDSLATAYAPGIAGGSLVEALKDYSAADVYNFIKLIKGENLWEKMPVEWRNNLIGLNSRVGFIERMDVDWFVEALKDDRPDLASLIINSGEVRQFLRKFIKDTQKGIGMV